MKNRFRTMDYKLHFCNGLCSVTSTKVTKKKGKGKIPAQPRILKAVLFTGSRPSSLMINED